LKIIAITPHFKTDGTTASIIEGMYDLGINVIASSLGNGVKKAYSDKEILEHSRDADFIFAFWGKIKGNRPPRYYLLDMINRPDISVYIDGSEWTCTGYQDTNENIFANWAGKEINKQLYDSKYDPSRLRGEPWINKKMLSFCKWYFKRECYAEDLDFGIIPLPFCANKDYIKDESEKDIDIFCCFGQNLTGMRAEIEKYCSNIKNKNIVVIKSKISKEEYNNILSRSMITVSSWGGGQCCFREWESLGSRSCSFTQRYTIEFPNKPVDNKHWVEYSNMKEFDEKIKFYLNNRSLCVKIANNGFNFLKNNHMPKNRVEYILEKIV